MKKKAKERLKKTGKTVRKYFNPANWMGYSHIETSADMIKQTVADIFIPPESGVEDDFSETVEQLGLSPEILKSKQKALMRLCVFLVFLMLIVLSYSSYQLYQGHYRAFIPSLVLSFVCLAFAFRYHFWYFQIKVQRLGCTFQEWLNYVLSGKKP